MNLSEIKNKIPELSNTIYIHTVDFLSFAKSLKKMSLEDKIINGSLKNANDMLNYIYKSDESNDITEILDSLKTILKLAELNLGQLQIFKCEKLLLNEKTDLIIDTHKIIEQTNRLTEIL